MSSEQNERSVTCNEEVSAECFAGDLSANTESFFRPESDSAPAPVNKKERSITKSSRWENSFVIKSIEITLEKTFSYFSFSSHGEVSTLTAVNITGTLFFPCLFLVTSRAVLAINFIFRKYVNVEQVLYSVAMCIGYITFLSKSSRSSGRAGSRSFGGIWDTFGSGYTSSSIKACGWCWFCLLFTSGQFQNSWVFFFHLPDSKVFSYTENFVVVFLCGGARGC